MKSSKVILLLVITLIGLLLISCGKKISTSPSINNITLSNPNPENNAKDVSINTNLSWSCTDSEGDSLTYDVYFGTDSTPDSGELVSTNQSATTYNPGTLNYETTYYWKIVAKDVHNNSTTGSVWQFTTQTSSGSVFEWCNIPAGDYTYGQNNETQNIAYDYQIMKYEVTNAQYLEYLEEAYANGDITIDGDYVKGYYPGDEHISAGNQNFYHLGTPSSYNYARISWNGSSFVINVPSGYNTGDFDNHPVVYVTWFGAWAFAQHYGFRLPTEEEWEKAARGNTGYDYPWGDSIDGSRANYKNSGDAFDNGTTPVGYYNGQNGTTDSPSPYGVYDMVGNVWEWTDRRDNFSLRVGCGGSWNNNTDYLQSWSCSYGDPDDSYGDLGFRCVCP